MKGLVFTEFAELVEAKFGLEVLDRIIETTGPASGGAWTAVGTYDAADLVALVGALSKETGERPAVLVRTFGEHLLERFADHYPEFFAPHRSAFHFLRNVESYIHAEVLKLYPDAQLPRFTYDGDGAKRLVVTYRSRHAFADLAEGLIRGAIAHYREPISLQREDLSPPGQAARFVLERTAV
jgi:hypothetical protein